METYTLLRQFADSWWLLFMMAFFIGAVLFALRPGSRKIHRDAANIPLRDDDPQRLDPKTSEGER
ncbi:MAG: cbb3-type cytochrome c oxidase subunit 3 [Pseudomonadota bacterium]